MSPISIDREDFAKYLHHNSLTMFNVGGPVAMVSCECPVAVYLTYKFGSSVSCSSETYTHRETYPFPKWVTDFIRTWDYEYFFQPTAGSAALAILNQLPV